MLVYNSWYDGVTSTVVISPHWLSAHVLVAEKYAEFFAPLLLTLKLVFFVVSVAFVVFPAQF